MTDSYTIVRAETQADCDSLQRLIRELADFEKLTPPDEAAMARFYNDGFVRSPPRFEAWLARHEDAAVGYAIIFETYSTFLCRPTLYLEDLFVSPAHRSQGIGGGLVRHCAALARQRGCGRMEWTCLDWNVNAQGVYDRIGAEHLKEWYLYRLNLERFEQE